MSSTLLMFQITWSALMLEKPGSCGIIALEPLLHGAGHEGGLRAGTENVASLIGLGKACSIAGKSLDENSEKLTKLRDRLLKQLRDVIGPALAVHGEKRARGRSGFNTSLTEANAI